MSRRALLGRALLGLLVVAVVWLVARIEHTRPDAVRLVLFVGVGIAMLGLLVDTAVLPPPDWEVERGVPVVPAGQDAAVSRYVRMLENHLTTRGEDPLVQHRLARLVDDRLAGANLSRSDPAARQLLGPVLDGVVNGPTRLLTRAELDTCLRRIEELTT